jgi:hypothetical protein
LDALKIAYIVEKVAYDTFCEKKIAQIPACNHMTTQEAIQRIEEKRLEAFHA